MRAAVATATPTAAPIATTKLTFANQRENRRVRECGAGGTLTLAAGGMIRSSPSAPSARRRTASGASSADAARKSSRSSRSSLLSIRRDSATAELGQGALLDDCFDVVTHAEPRAKKPSADRILRNFEDGRDLTVTQALELVKHEDFPQ